jgi:exosortase family protein XrtG
VECSAILEMSAFAGLIGFYPGFNGVRKAITIVVGLVLTYLLNIARILLIVAIINMGGTSWVFSAHAIFGRVLFFAGVIAIFWYLVTRPTIRIVSGQMEAVTS